jgi:hypothetical protein
VDVETIATVLFVIGAFALILMLLRRLPPSDDDVAVVVAGIVRTPVELDRPPAAGEEPLRWRVDLLRPRPVERSLTDGPQIGSRSRTVWS